MVPCISNDSILRPCHGPVMPLARNNHQISTCSHKTWAYQNLEKKQSFCSCKALQPWAHGRPLQNGRLDLFQLGKICQDRTGLEGLEKAHLWKYGNDKFQTKKHTHTQLYQHLIGIISYIHILLSHAPNMCIHMRYCMHFKKRFPYTCWQLIPHMESHKSALLSAAVRLGNCLGLQRSMFVSS